MSHSNSKNRKSNFSNNPPPSSESQTSLNPPYNPNYKPQAPSGQPSFSNRNISKPHGQTADSFDPFPPAKTSNEKTLSNFQSNPPNNGFPPFYPQPPSQNEQNQSMNFQQQPNYPNYSNAGLEFQQNIANFPNYGQNVNNLLPGYLDFNPPNLGTQMIEEEPNIPAGDPRSRIKRARKEPTGINEELEVIHKKNKTENQYSERLQILANELAKVKEFEVQTIKALFNTPTLTASTVKGRKEWDNLVSQRMSLANIQLLYPDFLTEAALQNIPHETLKSVLTDLLSRKPRDANQLEAAKKDLIDQVHKEQGVEEEKEELCKVVHVSTQQFYQANPTIKEYEDKLDRMEVVLRDKKAKVREATKKVGSAKFELDIALAKWEIANRRVKEMEPVSDS